MVPTQCKVCWELTSHVAPSLVPGPKPHCPGSSRAGSTRCQDGGEKMERDLKNFPILFSTALHTVNKKHLCPSVILQFNIYSQ